MDLPPHQDVFHDAHLGERLQVLEGAGNPAPGDLVGGESGYPLLPQEYVAAGRLAAAGDGIEKGGLPGPVRADDGEDLSLRHADGDVGERLQPAEGHAQ